MSSIQARKPDETKVYPNPAKEQMRVSVGKTFNEAQEITYRVTNLEGVIVAEGALAKERTIDISKLQTGLYILELNQNSKTEQVKFSRQ